MRAVLDTNVLISGLLWRGIPHQCLLAAEAELYDLILAVPILEELHEKLTEKFDHSTEEADGVLDELRRLATLANLTGKSGWVKTDPDDDKFVEAAIVGNAEIIVSGDHHLQHLDTVEGVEILTPRQFIERLTDE